MAQLTKQALQVENNQSFPNNNVGAITPTILREFNTDVIDSTVNQTVYTADSASWNQSISALNTFTASQQPSFTALNAFTASQLTINSGYNSATQSLSASIAGVTSEVDVLQAWSSSVNQIADNGVVQGTSTRLHFYGLVSASIVPNVGGAIAVINVEQDGTKLNTGSFNSYTQSVNSDLSSIHETTASLNAFTSSALITGSVDGSILTFTKGNGSTFSLAVTASVATVAWNNVTGKPSGLVSGSSQVVDILNPLNTFSASQETKDSTLASYTGSVDTKFSTIGSASGSWINTALNTYTQSQDTKNSTLATYTASVDTKFTAVGSSTSSLNAYTQSNDTKWSNLASQSGSWVTSAITGSSLITGSVTGNVLTFTKGNGTAFSLTVATGSGGGGTIATGSFATTGSNVFVGDQTIQSDGDKNGIYFISGSEFFVGQNEVGRFVISSSQNNRWIELNNDNGFAEVYAQTTNFNNSVNLRGRTEARGIFQQSGYPVQIDGTLSASLQAGYAFVGGADGYSKQVPTSSFAGAVPVGVATTGSNNFIGDQTITGSVNISGGEHLFVKRSTTGANQLLRLGATDNENNFAFIVTGSDTNPGQQVWGINTAGGIWANSFDAGVVFNSYVTASQGLNISNGTFSAPLQQGYVWVGDSNNRTSLIPTSSFGGSTNTGSLMTTGSVSGNVLTFTKGDASTFTLTVATGSSSTIDTGSFATTGSNTFTGDQTLVDAAGNRATLTDVSGSFGITNGNIDSVFNVLGNAGANPNARLGGNLLFKTAVNQSGSLVISGSGNIVTAMPTLTAGFRSQLSGNNIGSGTPSVSASMAFPININNNISLASSTFRGPVSSSTYSLSSNYFGGSVTLGTSGANNFEKGIAGVSLSNNVINANVNAIANTTNLTSAFSIANSNINQALTINATSSSVQISNSNMGGASATITNRAFHTLGSNNHMIIASTLTSGQTTTINADGASATNVVPGVVASLLGGSATTIQLGAVGVTTDSNQLRNSIVFGNNIVVTGSNSQAATNTQGSAFVGRWNSIDAGKNDSSNVVFAVGTGTSTTRKTGFLIDSGSNTFVEGTLNVSGSTSTTGSITIQSGSGDLFVHGHKQFNVGAFQSNISQSGSANVSQSMQFEVTDISQGVTMVDNSKITLANSGTYNIQFSAQIDRISGSGVDDVYIWLKKNGVNVANTTGQITVSGGANEAKTIQSWNYVVETTNSDYWELVWQSTDSNIHLSTFTPGGNIPNVPSIILTVTQAR